MKAMGQFVSFAALVTASVLLSACATTGGPDAATPLADTIFVGKHIVTMDGSKPEAVAVRGDTIAATGTRTAILRLQRAGTRLVELGEHALLPGFRGAMLYFILPLTAVTLLVLSARTARANRLNRRRGDG